jgi:hypothetical protein
MNPQPMGCRCQTPFHVGASGLHADSGIKDCGIGNSAEAAVATTYRPPYKRSESNRSGATRREGERIESERSESKASGAN